MRRLTRRILFMTLNILQQQIEYYRARAGENDEWFSRKGDFELQSSL